MKTKWELKQKKVNEKQQKQSIFKHFTLTKADCVHNNYFIMAVLGRKWKQKW